jgi:hypothetical protein
MGGRHQAGSTRPNQARPAGLAASSIAGSSFPAPPWDQASAHALPALPEVAPTAHRTWLIILAVLLLLAAAAAGYFGVLAIAGLG